MRLFECEQMRENTTEWVKGDPPEHGWYLAYTERWYQVLWYNPSSLGTGWWQGRPGKCMQWNEPVEWCKKLSLFVCGPC